MLNYWSKYLPDTIYLKIRYKRVFKRSLNLNQPVTFNEKLQWLKLYDRNAMYTRLVDKYEAKEYFKQVIGEDYVIPTLGIWNDFDDIDFNKLPNQFVLKCTHDSGSVYICKDKTSFSYNSTRKKIKEAMKSNFYLKGREWPYKNVVPRIIAEKYIIDDLEGDIKDYKIFNFNGEPKFIQVDYNRFVEHKKNIYDVNWNLMDFDFNFERDPNVIIEKPSQLSLMLELSKKLSKNHVFLRTDFYCVNNSIYIGEVTFYPASGFGKFTPNEWDYRLGNMINLDSLKNNF